MGNSGNPINPEDSWNPRTLGNPVNPGKPGICAYPGNPRNPEDPWNPINVGNPGNSENQGNARNPGYLEIWEIYKSLRSLKFKNSGKSCQSRKFSKSRIFWKDLKCWTLKKRF